MRKKSAKTEKLLLRMSSDERKSWKLKAEEEGMNLSQWLRWQANLAARNGTRITMAQDLKGAKNDGN